MEDINASGSKTNSIKKIPFFGILLLTIFLLSIVFSIILIFVTKSKKDTSSLIKSEKNVVVMDISGMLTYKTCMTMALTVRKYSKMQNIKGLILRINSPGGTVGGTQELYNEILSFRSKGKIAIASFGDVCASGGYYLAMACDHIIAQRGSMTGSIGVIVNTFNLSGIMERFGIKSVVIKAGKFKDILNFSRDVTQEEIQLIQNLVDDTYGQFFEAVRKSRKDVPIEKLKEICDGRIFTGNIAKNLKMVDELGGYFQALEAMKRLAKLPDEPRVLTHKTSSLLDILNLFRNGDSENKIAAKLKEVLSKSEFSSPFLYLYTGL